MPTRAAILFDDGSEGHGALLSALTQVHHLTEVRSNAGPPDAGRTARAWWLARFRPDLVVSVATGPDALLAAAYRLLFPRTRLLVRLRGPAWRENLLPRLVRRLVLNRADAVLAEDTAAAAALPARWANAREGRERVFALSGPDNLDSFLACPLARPPGSIHRILFVGALSPRSGATDILLCVAAWAARNKDHPIEVWWAGDGDLAGILDAQPLPPGMSQRFLGPLDRGALAETMARCGVLVLPVEADGQEPEAAPVAEALAAGLVVVGSRCGAAVRRFVVDGVTGWTFDPRRRDQLGHAIARALGASSDTLSVMRVEGRRRMSRLAAETDAERLHAALSAMMPQPAGASARPALALLKQGAVGTRLPDPQ